MIAVGATVVYCSLAAMGRYEGTISAVRDDGLVNIAIPMRHRHHIELTKIEVVEKAALRQGTCYVVDQGQSNAP